MNVVAFNASPRKNGNTSLLISMVFETLKKEGISCELIHIGGKPLQGCRACDQCYKLKNNQCIFKDDELNGYIEKMIQADAILLGSPTYFANVTAEMKAFIDRSGRVGRANGYLFKHKVAAAIIAVRRAGSLEAFDAINHFFLIEQMIVAGSIYWNLGIGGKIGEVDSDDEARKNMENLGKNIAWILQKIHKSK